MKRLRYALEYLALVPVYQLLAWLPLRLTRALLGSMAAGFGRYLPINKVMMTNLRLAFPEMSNASHQKLARAAWRHLGYLIAEHPKIPAMMMSDNPKHPNAMMLVEGLSHIAPLAKGTPIIFISGHVGNWELLNAAATQAGVGFYPVYRQANNPYIEAHIQRFRPDGGRFIPKGAAGAKQILKVLKNGERVGMLVDQKMKEGLLVPFFGHPAATATACVELAWRYQGVLVPVYTYRRSDGRFSVVVEAPLTLPPKHEAEALAKALTLINNRLEAWIRQHPEQWLWLHRRWPKPHY